MEQGNSAVEQNESDLLGTEMSATLSLFAAVARLGTFIIVVSMGFADLACAHISSAHVEALLSIRCRPSTIGFEPEGLIIGIKSAETIQGNGVGECRTAPSAFDIRRERDRSDQIHRCARHVSEDVDRAKGGKIQGLRSPDRYAWMSDRDMERRRLRRASLCHDGFCYFAFQGVVLNGDELRRAASNVVEIDRNLETALRAGCPGIRRADDEVGPVIEDVDDRRDARLLFDGERTPVAELSAPPTEREGATGGERSYYDRGPIGGLGQRGLGSPFIGNQQSLSDAFQAQEYPLQAFVHAVVDAWWQLGFATLAGALGLRLLAYVSTRTGRTGMATFFNALLFLAGVAVVFTICLAATKPPSF